jgi:molybdopterin-guanine dinucleotide biosynthesis protein A
MPVNVDHSITFRSSRILPASFRLYITKQSKLRKHLFSRYRSLHPAPGLGVLVILRVQMNDAIGFITAGGQSSRMGADKALLDLHGRPMIEYVIAALAPVTTSVIVIANSPGYERLGLPIIADTQPGIGPLEAIRTALSNAHTARIILAGCDLPFVTSELFMLLLSLSGHYQATAPIGPSGNVEPLCAVYSAEALVVVTDLIAQGHRKVRLLFDRVPTRFVAFQEMRHLAGSDLFFENINNPEDYARARQRIQRINFKDR